MIRLGLRLTLASSGEALMRVLVTAAAVALGVGFLLAAMAGINGLQAQSDRGAWLNSAVQPTPPTSPARGLWWESSTDSFGRQLIDQIDVAAARPDAPIPPGMSRVPGPGQYFASPEMVSLLRSQPADELRDRYPGRLVGTIGGAGLPSPNSLIIVIGHRVGPLSKQPAAIEIGAIHRSLANCYGCQSVAGSGPVLEFILVGAAVALVLPILILIATASRLSAARREERFASMRLVGATPGQISTISAVEAIIAALAGVVLGFGLFFAVRPLLYHVPFTGAPMAPGDLSLHAVDILIAVVGVPIAAVVSARLALRRVQISPLGVTRRVKTSPPRMVRIIPLLAGIAFLAYFDAAGKPGAIGSQLLELLVGFVLLIVGLVLAGPWLTTAGSRIMAKRASRPATLIAGRRLLDNPKAAFRFVSGLVIALFVASAAIGAISSVTQATGGGGTNASLSTLVDPFCTFSTNDCPPAAVVASLPPSVLHELRATPGVRGVSTIHGPPNQTQQGRSFGVVACDELAETPAIGRCAPRATGASVGYFLSKVLGHSAHAATTTWPSWNLSATQLASLPVSAVVVATNGSSDAIERVRTELERAFPLQGSPVTVEALGPSTARLLTMIQALTDVIIVASLIIAACSLAVNIAAGLNERRRPFSLLRLAGVPRKLLHRVVTLESALPLLIVATVSIVVGLLAAALYLHSQVGLAFSLPGLSYWTTVIAGLALSMAIIAATFPILDRITGPEGARNA
jgi:FtsX-like permease family protein